MSKEKSKIHKITQILVDYLKNNEIITPIAEKKYLWSQIEQRALNNERRKKFHKKYTLFAAAAAILIGIIWINRYTSKSIDESDFSIEKIAQHILIPTEASEVTLVVSDGKKIQLKAGEDVTYSENGTISINSEKIDICKSTTSGKIEYNQLIVPRGRRSLLTLSDNTVLHINSGTLVVYPRYFVGNKREIYIDGEAYLEVFRNENKPFLVKTSSNFNIEVLGTSFNVCSYKELSTASVVLVKGSVNVQNANKKETLEPNQLINISSKGFSEKQIVNVSDYIGWVDGLMMLHSQPLGDVVQRLSIYFAIPIHVDSSIKNISLSGKLVLNDQLDDILFGLANIVPITYYKKDGTYEIKKAN